MKSFISEFELLGLSENVLRGVFSYGYSTPSSIQKKAIPSIIQKRNTVIQSKNGTGKTATFLLGVLQLAEEKGAEASKSIEAVVLSPTRDLALQSFSVFKGLSKFTSVKGHCAVGGHATSADIHALQSRAHSILFCTPGRLLQIIRESPKHFKGVRSIVVDEADRILESGFGTQVKSIFDLLAPSAPQFIFASATLPKAVTEMLEVFLKDPEMFLLPEETLSLSSISQYYAVAQEEDKFGSLCDILGSFSISQAVIFANKKDTVAALEKTMRTHGFSVSSLHSDLSQTERVLNLDGFFKGKHKILLSTDISSRGIDAPHVNLVVNFDLPITPEEYLHRIGRGGRFGKTATAVSLVTPQEAPRISSIFGPFGRSIKEYKRE